MRIEAFLAHLERVKQTGPTTWEARCPAHDDKTPSLTVGIGRSQPIVVKCFSGCSGEDIAMAVGLEMRDLCQEEYDSRLGFVAQLTGVEADLRHELLVLMQCLELRGRQREKRPEKQMAKGINFPWQEEKRAALRAAQLLNQLYYQGGE